MINNRTLSSSATMAISAVLALVSTPALAQTADPVVAAPVAAAPAPATPAIVIPEVTTAPTATEPQSAPQIAPTPQEVAATPAETAPATTRTTVRESAARAQRTAPRAAAPVAVAAPVAAIPAARTITPAVAPATIAPENPIAQPSARPVTATATPPASESANWALPIGALALLGIGGVAVAASRRRRVMPYDVAEPEYVTNPPEAPAAVTTPATAMADTALEPVATPVVTPPSGTRFANLLSADFAEDGPVPTGEAREALLERMAAAAPDEANPFKSPQGRRRRARLILQARENRWAEREVETPVVAPVRRQQAAPVRVPEPEYA